MASPGTINRTNAVEISIQAVEPVSIGIFSAEKAISGSPHKGQDNRQSQLFLIIGISLRRFPPGFIAKEVPGGIL